MNYEHLADRLFVAWAILRRVPARDGQAMIDTAYGRGDLPIGDDDDLLSRDGLSEDVLEAAKVLRSLHAQTLRDLHPAPVESVRDADELANRDQLRPIVNNHYADYVGRTSAVDDSLTGGEYEHVVAVLTDDLVRICLDLESTHEGGRLYEIRQAQMMAANSIISKMKAQAAKCA